MMNVLIEKYKFFENYLYSGYIVIYNFLENSFYLIFSYCPFHFQMVYFWFPMLYIIRLKVASKKQTSTWFDNSTINWIVIFIKSDLRLFLSKLYVNIKKILLKFLLILEKNSIFLNVVDFMSFFFKKIKFIWRPLFKKISYFGYLMNIFQKRSKDKRKN